MKKMNLLLIFCLMFSMFITIPRNDTVYAANTSYYVDSVAGNDDTNNGTSASTPWKTLAKVNSVTFGPGDKILFKAGSTWTGQLMPLGSGASGNPIIIDMYGSGNKPAIDALGTTANDGYVVRLYNQSYWEINNLDLKNNATSGDWRGGILVLAERYGTVNHIYVKNNYIHDIRSITDVNVYVNAMKYGSTPYPNVTRAEGDWGNVGAINFRALWGGDGTVPSKFNDIVVQNNDVRRIHNYGVGVGISSDFTNSFPTNASTNININNNYFEYTAWAGVNVYGVDGSIGTGATVSNNVINGTPSYGAAAAAMWPFRSKQVIFQNNEVYGGRFFNGDSVSFDIDGGNDGIIFQYNYSHDNEGGAFLAWDYGPSINGIIRYNISQNDQMAGNTPIFKIGESNVVQIYNNTIYRPANTSGVVVSQDPSKPNAQAAFKNNIFYNLSSQGSYSVSTVTFDYNTFYGISLPGEPSDAHKLTSDPKFVFPGAAGHGINSTSVYALQPGSPSINSGIPIANNGGKDFFGRVIASTPSRGAIEYGGTFPAQPLTKYATIWNNNNTAVTYSGFTAGTRAGNYNGDFHSSATANSYYQFTFSGTQARIFSTKNDWMGNADVYVDGIFNRTLDLYASAQSDQQLVYDTGVLTDASHTVKVVVKGTKNTLSLGYWVEIDRIDVINRNLITTNPGFESGGGQNPVGWSTWSNGDGSADYVETAQPHTGSYNLAQYSAAAFQVHTYQSKTGLVSGLYTLKAWVKSGGSVTNRFMSAKNYGGSEVTTNIPFTSTYKQITITNINVTNGQCTIGFWSDAAAGSWMVADDVEFYLQ